MKKIIYDFVDNYIYEYKYKIFYEMEHNERISQNAFYEIFIYLFFK